MGDVQALLVSLHQKWRGTSYDILERNCCHFCDHFCLQLRVGHIPTWVQSLAAAGAMLRSIAGFSAGSRDGEDLTEAVVEETVDDGYVKSPRDVLDPTELPTSKARGRQTRKKEVAVRQRDRLRAV